MPLPSTNVLGGIGMVLSSTDTNVGRLTRLEVPDETLTPRLIHVLPLECWILLLRLTIKEEPFSGPAVKQSQVSSPPDVEFLPQRERTQSLPVSNLTLDFDHCTP